MNGNTPFLLLMPSYNQAHFIVDAVRSVLAQDDANWELWIVDNSNDNTPAVMAQFVDPRIRFHHIPQRMDPGTCLNWMLERAIGRDFSYVHTDNNLGSSYVRKFREALADHPLGLAYCDMRVIDEQGRYSQVFRRGEFNFPRLLSADTLGVPFAATTELVRAVGGFSVSDVADDVRFCVGAYGLAHYIHLREPLVDYRLHASSRTEDAGGYAQIQRVFADLMPKIVPTLEQRGLRPIQVLEDAIREGLDDLDLFIEDHWYRGMAKLCQPWWLGAIRVDHFFFVGLLDIPGFSKKLGRAPRGQIIRDAGGQIRAMPWTGHLLRGYLKRQRGDLYRIVNKSRNMLVTWACMKLKCTSGGDVAFRIKHLEFRTVWAARQLEVALGWKPLLDPGITTVPKWLHWERATGTEPVLDCSREISLSP